MLSLSSLRTSVFYATKICTMSHITKKNNFISTLHCGSFPQQTYTSFSWNFLTPMCSLMNHTFPSKLMDVPLSKVLSHFNIIYWFYWRVKNKKKIQIFFRLHLEKMVKLSTDNERRWPPQYFRQVFFFLLFFASIFYKKFFFF